MPGATIRRWKRPRIQHLGSTAPFPTLDRAFLVRGPAFDVSAAGWTELERRVQVATRWWTIPELESMTCDPESLAAGT
jgi:hypothetical protein